MKGYRKVDKHHNRKMITDNIINKHLPYGKWTTADHKEYLFNRDYEPIMGWDLETDSPIAVNHNLWVKDIVNAEWYYGNEIADPTDSVAVMRKLWNILAEWGNRLHRVQGSVYCPEADKSFWGDATDAPRTTVKKVGLTKEQAELMDELKTIKTDMVATDIREHVLYIYKEHCSRIAKAFNNNDTFFEAWYCGYYVIEFEELKLF